MFSFDLSSMIMLKDNAIASCGSITAAVQKARGAGVRLGAVQFGSASHTPQGFSIKIEVECGNENDACEAIEAGADVIMLDNLNGPEMVAAAASLKSKFPHGRYLIEASGGITLATCEQYMGEHVDVISMGCIIQGVPHVDFSLKIVPGE